MSLKEKELKINELKVKLSQLYENKDNHALEIQDLENTLKRLQEEAYQDITAYDRVYLARKQDRSNIYEYIDDLCDDFIEFHGDRYFKDDGSIVGGIAMFNDIPVTIVGQRKGRTVEENLKCNFGMSSPQGYRKALRLMKQAEKFNRPIITFVDTPGAYPGLESEENGIGESIAKNLMELSTLSVPIIVVIIGEGGSGGALALSIGDRLVMLENAIYSVLSPEGFSSILWKDQKGERVEEAAELMKLTAKDLYEASIIDHIISEPSGGVGENPAYVYKQLKAYIEEELKVLMKMNKTSLIKKRYEKYRVIGEVNYD